MRQIWIARKGPPEVLQVREAADPQAGAGQVRIRVKASGINFADLMGRMGLYPDAPPIPFVPGYEIAGVVDQAGPGVTSPKVGDRVVAITLFGGYSDIVVVPSGMAFGMPANMSFESGAALPVNYLTAHHMMFHIGPLHEGSRILIHSAAGGVGVAAIQLARTRHCVIFGAASVSKHPFLKELGVQHSLDSGRDLAAQVRSVLGLKEGLDLVLDPVGGASWDQGYRLLGPTGRLVAFGFSAAANGKRRNLLRASLQFFKSPRFSPLRMMNDNKTVSGVNMAHLFDRADLMKPQMAELFRLYTAGQLAPHVDRTFPFEEAAAAHHYLHDRKAKGKVVLVP